MHPQQALPDNDTKLCCERQQKRGRQRARRVARLDVKVLAQQLAGV